MLINVPHMTVKFRFEQKRVFITETRHHRNSPPHKFATKETFSKTNSPRDKLATKQTRTRTKD